MDQLSPVKIKFDELYDTDPKHYVCSSYYYKFCEYKQCFIEKILYGVTNGIVVYEKNSIEKILYESTKKNVKVLVCHLSGEKQDTLYSSTKELSELIKLHISKQQQQKAYFLVLGLEEEDMVSDAHLVYLWYGRIGKTWYCHILPLVYNKKIDAEYKFLSSELKTVKVRVGSPEYPSVGFRHFRIDTVIDLAALRIRFMIVNDYSKENYFLLRSVIYKTEAYVSRKNHQNILKPVISNISTKGNELKLNESDNMDSECVSSVNDGRMIVYEEIDIKRILIDSTNMNIQVSLGSYYEAGKIVIFSLNDNVRDQIKLYSSKYRKDAVWYLVANLNEEGLVDFAYLAYLHYKHKYFCVCYIMTLVNFAMVEELCNIFVSELEYENVIILHKDRHDFGITSLRVEQLIEYAKLRMKNICPHNLREFLLILKNIIMAKPGTYKEDHRDIFKKFNSET